MFSCEFCEIFKDIFFIEHFRWLPLKPCENGVIPEVYVKTPFLTCWLENTELILFITVANKELQK